MKTPRVIIYAKPEEYVYAALMARTLSGQDYQWPEDGLTLFDYGEKPFTLSFAAKRNKSGFTIYSQQLGSAK